MIVGGRVATVVCVAVARVVFNLGPEDPIWMATAARRVA
jgi:hypothetical protein